MTLRRRVSLLYWVPVALLCVGGYVLDRRATANRATASESQSAALLVRVETLEKTLSELTEVLKDQKGLIEALATREVPMSGSSADPAPVLLKPRVMGSGVSGNWRYVDIRLPSGSVNRYYISVHASPVAVHSFVRRIADDVEDDRVFYGFGAS